MSESDSGHPLFLSEDDEKDPVDVSEIQIVRIENGQQVFYPRLFQAAELQSLEHVYAELGGGSYILIARDNGRITTRRKYVIPGKPKPMYDEGRQEPVEKVVPPIAPIDPMLAQSGGMMPFFMMMMQQMNQAADRQMQLVIAMMQGGRESSSEDKATARAEMQANLERERIASEKQMTMMREMMQLAQSSKPDSSAGFTQGVEFMRAFSVMQIEQLKSAKGGDDTDWGSLIETIGQAVQGFGLLNSMSKGGPLPEGVAAATEVIP